MRSICGAKGKEGAYAPAPGAGCRAEQETAMEFSIDAECNIPFDLLDCGAYDLACDPDKAHAIRPILIGPDGISKKIAVPFLEPLTPQQPFCVPAEMQATRLHEGGCDAWPDVRASQMGRRDPGGSPVKSGEREPREGVYVFEAGTLLSASRFFLPLRPTGRFIAAWSDRLLAAESAPLIVLSEGSPWRRSGWR